MHKKNIKKSVIASCFFAGCLEMYDFVIFGFLAPIIHKNYLSFLDKNTALIITYLFFAVGFICRPLGALVFGHIGDRYGRKKSLVISMSFMGLSSLVLCLLPSYEAIGIISCYIIAFVRIIQGLSVGGEYSGAAIYAIEHFKRSNIGAVGYTVLAGTTCGVLLATFVSDLIDKGFLPEYGWRFAFLLGSGLAVIGYFIRKKLGESPLFEEKNSEIKKPLLYGLKFYKREFIGGALLSGANNANYYFALVFVPNYFKTHFGGGLEYNNWMLALFMLILEPTFGWLSDGWNRNKALITICSILAAYNLIFLDAIIATSSIFFLIISALLLSTIVSSVNIFVLEIFPTECRYSCGALSYSIGAAVFGGTTPLICSMIIEHFGNKPIYFGAYVSLISLLGAFGGMLILKKRTKSLENKGIEDNKLITINPLC